MPVYDYNPGGLSLQSPSINPGLLDRGSSLSPQTFVYGINDILRKPNLGTPLGGAVNSNAGGIPDAANQGMSMADKFSLAGKGLKGLNKMVSTVLMLREMDKDRRQRADQIDKEMSLAKKSMIIDYLLGNRQYRDALKALNIKLSTSGTQRARGQSGIAAQRRARTVR